MSGNVWEWCEDRCASGKFRVLRGGSWLSYVLPELFRCARRNYFSHPEVRCDRNGFRVARTC
jgi:formylglycine-generating enzyme required for sulfatase activity